MKLTTLALIVLWPATIYYVLKAIATVYAAWWYSRNPREKLRQQIETLQTGMVTVHPWRTNILIAVICMVLLAYLQGWLILG